MDFEELVKKYPVGARVKIHGVPGEVCEASEYLAQRTKEDVLDYDGSIFATQFATYVTVRQDDGYLSGWMPGSVEVVTPPDPVNKTIALIGQLIKEAEERGYQRALADMRAELDELSVIK